MNLIFMHFFAAGSRDDRQYRFARAWFRRRIVGDRREPFPLRVRDKNGSTHAALGIAVALPLHISNQPRS